MRALFIFLLLAAQAQGALTVTDRGVDASTTAGTTWAIGPASTIAAGSTGVLMMAFDNAGSGGSVKLLTNATINDSVGNVWTRRLNFIYDAGAASAGVEIGVYTGVITTAMTSSNTLTITFGTAPGNIAAVWNEVTAGAGNTVSYVTGAASCDGCTTGQSGTTYTITSGTITVGDVIFGMVGAEITSAPAGDVDTTNGAWSNGGAGQGTGSGGAMSIKTAWKIQITADSTQTYNGTLTSADWEAAWIQLRESGPPSPTPTAAPNTGFLPFFVPGLIWLKSLWKR